MSSPFSFSKIDLKYWLHAGVAYFLGALLVGVGMSIAGHDFGTTWTPLLSALGGMIADLGRRFFADTTVPPNKS